MNMKAAGLMVKCLETEGVNVIFGLPGEENTENIPIRLRRHRGVLQS
jgi:thiamine pyrophosphate-dependent acetolactate synthase large subunit-like protein